MKKIFLLGVILTLSACTQQNTKLLNENTADRSQIPDQQIIDPILKNEDLKSQSKSSRDNKNSSMTNPRTTINDSIELKDLAAEYSGATIKTNLGEIKLKFYNDLSPLTVNNFMNLAQVGFYNGTRFHRIISDFMIQGGDPLSKEEDKKMYWGTGGPNYKFKDEFNNKPLVRGSFAMANSGPATNGSQFFIVTKDSTPWLDGKHTNFGEVIEGMDVVEQIEAVETDSSDKPLNDIILESIELTK